MQPTDQPGRMPHLVTQTHPAPSNRWPFVSLACGIASILLLPLFHPLIAVVLRRLFPDNWIGAYVQFLAVPLLLTIAALVTSIAAVRRSYRLPARHARFGLAALALTVGILDVGLFFVGWVPTVTEAHTVPYSSMSTDGGLTTLGPVVYYSGDTPPNAVTTTWVKSQ